MPVTGLTLYRTHRSVRYRYRCRTDTGTNSGTDVRTGTGGSTGINVITIAEVSGTGIDALPNLPKCPVPRTELSEVSGTGMKVCTGTGGTGIHIVTNLPKFPVPVLLSYRTYRGVRYR